MTKVCDEHHGHDRPIGEDLVLRRTLFVQTLHGAISPTVLFVTGGGFASVTDLLTVPGASQTVIEMSVPYSTAALEEIVPDVDGAVSLETSMAMANAALVRCRSLAPDEPSVVGLGCTAALVTNRPKRGAHRAHVAIASSDGTSSAWTLTLAKQHRDRSAEDRLVSDLILLALAEPLRLDDRLGLASELAHDDDELIMHDGEQRSDDPIESGTNQ